MSDDKVLKIGYYTITVVKINNKKIYRVDSGKIIYIPKLRRYQPNPYRDVKDFSTLEMAKSYIKIKLDKNKIRKEKIIKKLPKSLYLILIKEESTNKLFVKVGITSKRFIVKRFSKIYGYDGYIVDTILRRVDTLDAEELEKNIKDILNKKGSVKKYRPLLESFSGYSECFDYSGLDEIIKVFDTCTINY